MRGGRPIRNKYGVNLTRNLKLALRYILSVSDMRFVFESKAFLSKSAGNADNVVCKEYWTQITALRIIVGYTPDMCHVHPTSTLPPLPMVAPILTTLAFIDWDTPLEQNLLIGMCCRDRTLWSAKLYPKKGSGLHHC